MRVKIDYAERGNNNYLVICDHMSGFIQVYKTHNKSTERALQKLREWDAYFGLPLLLIANSGNSFRNTFIEECAKLGGI